jgi:hypothetical protein
MLNLDLLEVKLRLSSIIEFVRLTISHHLNLDSLDFKILMALARE